ncbi:gamma-glutamyl-gamma-aminobutyrate hydrolase family protein [Pseudomonas hormoni]|uniref:Gamma-glutamyl-gamma-aminobutyrate hydrolase family protein n=1 Tax=Pseudomonas hormoni TaxID=3093767 RepID=A0ABX8EVQ7_9PSED|nr:gamma-glutamyl-gamma-aminobutyrate hydrolase family protein [Pseudomonas hormoni]QVW23096.1 gamma-glutamyl-gamma-aminobutyrate hydrolase family protein [Pseudomonas hormoni]
MSRLPLIGVAICSRQIGLHAYHISGDRYVHAKARVAKGVPSTLVSPANRLAPSDILDGLHDILFTGCPFNIERFYLGSPTNVSAAAHDSARANLLSLPHAITRVGSCARQLQWQSVSSDAHASNNA